MVSIIILTVNRPDFLKRCIQSIIDNTTTSYEFVFILQGSNKETYDYVVSIQQPKIIYCFDTNTGVTPGRNKGIELASGDFLLFFDDDAFVKENLVSDTDWLGTLVNSAKDSGISGQSGSFINPKTPGVFWESKVAGEECDVVQGYCFLFSRDVVNKIGCLDPYFGKFWHEESEFCLRAKDSGFKVINAGYVGVQHVGSGSGDDGTYAKKIDYMFSKWKSKFNQILVKKEWL